MKLMGLIKKTCMSHGNNNYQLTGVDLYVEIDRIKNIDYDEDRSNTHNLRITTKETLIAIHITKKPCYVNMKAPCHKSTNQEIIEYIALM